HQSTISCAPGTLICNSRAPEACRLQRRRGVKKLLHVALGIVTSFGGFLEAGSITTSIQAGAEYGYSLLWVLLVGTICLVALIEMSGRLAAMSHHTIRGRMREMAAGFVPSGAPYDASRYWFLAVSILGATLTQYLFYFYSSGAVEDGWEPDDVPANRFVSTFGMGFGATLAAAVLVVAALVFMRGARLESFDQMAPMLTDALGPWGFPLFVAALGIACFGA